jgi:hypothetical protein
MISLYQTRKKSTIINSAPTKINEQCKYTSLSLNDYFSHNQLYFSCSNIIILGMELPLQSSVGISACHIFGAVKGKKG